MVEQQSPKLYVASSTLATPAPDTKYCNRCKKTLLKEDFGLSSKRYDGLQTYCSSCMKSYRLEHYYKNKDQYYNRNKKTKAKLRQYVLEIKNSGVCADCGISYINEPWLLEFDHTDNDKLHSIGSSVNRGSFKKLKEEIKKCELCCLICHRRRTASRGDWKPNGLQAFL